jgi:cytolysin-activating lysine-acyltransferase
VLVGSDRGVPRVTVKSKDLQATAGKVQSKTNGPSTNGAKQTAADVRAIAAKPAPKNAQEALADPKIRAQIAEMRGRIHSTLGQVVLAMAALPRYQYLSLIDLKAIAVEPLIRAPLEQASLIVATHKKDDDAPSLEIGALDNVAGIAIWASVSTEVDARIRAQVKARVFPVKLKPEDWTSGSTDGGDHAPLGQEGLLDVPLSINGAPSSISKSPKLASMVLASFSRLVKTGELNVHPVAARQVDAEMLRKLAGDGAPAKSA